MKELPLRFIVVLTLLVACTCGSIAFCQSQDTADQSAVRQAMFHFADLLCRDDLADAKSAFGGNAESWKIVELTNQAMLANQRSQALAGRLFPREFAAKKHGDDLTPDGLKRRAREGAVEINGDDATIAGDNGMHLKRIENAWKVTDLAGSDVGKMFLKSVYAKLIASLTETSNDAEAGKFKSLAEMDRATNERMKAAMWAGSKASSKPTTQPGEIAPAHLSK